MENNYSLSDIRAATDGGMGCGNAGGGVFFMLILFLFAMMGGGMWGNRGGDYGQYATAASQQDILFSSKFQAIDNKIDRIGNGIADATFALNNTIHNAQDVVAGAVVSEGRGLSEKMCNLGARMDQQTAAIQQAIHAEGEATRNLIQQDTIQNLRDRVQSLEGDARMCNVVRWPNQFSVPAQSPFCNCNCNCG